MSTTPSKFRLLVSSTLLPSAFTLALAATGGFLCAALHLPIAWMIGSMVATAIAAIARLPVMNPVVLRPPVRAMVGSMLGASITPDVAQRVAQWAIPVAGLLVSATIGATIGWFILRRLGKLDPVTAFFGAMPGGLTEMIIMGDAKGGSPSYIALLHTVRVFTVILSMPLILAATIGLGQMPAAASAVTHGTFYDVTSLAWFFGCILLGIPLGRLVRLPSPDMFGPLILSGLAHFFGFSTFSIPSELMSVVQVVLGIGVGVRFLGLTIGTFAKLAGLSILVLSVHGMAAGSVAYLVNQMTGIEYVLLLLAYAPAGLTEMSLIAIALQRDAVFVALHHLVRILGVIVISPPMSNLALGSAKPPPD